jgi:hypothetical protein
LLGTSADDVLSGLGGNDVVDGSSGTDTAQFVGDRSYYLVQKAGSLWRVTDEAGIEGTDTLLSIERVQFADSSFDLINPPRPNTVGYGTERAFLFDPVYYLLANSELVPSVSLGGAAQHYFDLGAAAGKSPNSWFDATYYEDKWSDLTPLRLDDSTLFAHFNLFGVWEGRAPGPKFEFDGQRYLAENTDVAAYVDAHVVDFLGSRSNGAIAHYIIYGANEQRVAYDTSGESIDLGFIV